MPDSSWADLARASREALAQLGYFIGPQCLPGEPDECGGSFAQHTAAHLAGLKAVADHHLAHLPVTLVAAMFGDVYSTTEADLAKNCDQHQGPRRD